MADKRRLFSDPSEPLRADQYLALAATGITPDSPMSAVMAASYALLDLGMTPDLHVCWNELRLIERRLAVDFFLYDLSVDPALSPAGVAAVPPLPVGWLESLAYPLPAEREFASCAPSEPAPFLDEPPAPWPSAAEQEGGDHELG